MEEEKKYEREKIAVVTGGVRGIGLGISLALKKKGYRVYALYSKDEKSAAAAQGEGVIPVKADVRNEAEIVAFFSVLRHVDVLVNNAGIARCGAVAGYFRGDAGRAVRRERARGVSVRAGGGEKDDFRAERVHRKRFFGVGRSGGKLRKRVFGNEGRVDCADESFGKRAGVFGNPRELRFARSDRYDDERAAYGGGYGSAAGGDSAGKNR